MNKIERIIQPVYGPRFFRAESGEVMFEHRIDSRACIGPRIATKIDKQNHLEKWQEYLAAQTSEENSKIQKRRK